MSLGAFLRCALYWPIERLAYLWMVFGSGGVGALLYVLLNTIKSWYALATLRMIRNMAANPETALVAVGRLSGIDWGALENQERFLYSYAEEKIMDLPLKRTLVRRSASGAEVVEGVHAEVGPRYSEKIADRGMSMEYAWLVRRRCWADGIDTTAILTLAEQGGLIKLTSSIVRAAVADVVMPESRPPSSSALPSDGKNWAMHGLAKIDEGERIELKRLLRN